MKELKYPIVAFDFDGTIAHTPRYPEIDFVYQEAIAAIKDYQSLGGKTILWTCRTGKHLEDAVLICNQNGIQFDEVNANIKEAMDSYKAAFPDVPSDCRKIFAHRYIDDKNYDNWIVPWEQIHREILQPAKRNIRE